MLNNKGKFVDDNQEKEEENKKNIVVELKSVQDMREVFWKQTLTYLRLLGLKVGILVNFNVDNILDDAIHRIVNHL